MAAHRVGHTHSVIMSRVSFKDQRPDLKRHEHTTPECIVRKKRGMKKEERYANSTKAEAARPRQRQRE